MPSAKMEKLSHIHYRRLIPMGGIVSLSSHLWKWTGTQSQGDYLYMYHIKKVQPKNPFNIL